MDGNSDFSVNSTAFPTIKNLTQTLHSEGKKMVLIVDAGLSSTDHTNQYYSEALTKNLLLKSSINKDKNQGILTQHVWQNTTVFLDFFDENSKDVWGKGLRDLHDLIPYDGIWLDMNEATGFCNGECPDGKTNYSATVPTK
jgi:alpha-glucosidase (family GH31 glycosyl hydrolase)